MSALRDVNPDAVVLRLLLGVGLLAPAAPLSAGTVALRGSAAASSGRSRTNRGRR